MATRTKLPVYTHALNTPAPPSTRIDTGVSERGYWMKQCQKLTAENTRLQAKLKELNTAMAQTDTARRQRADQETALAIYGESEEVKSLTTRLNYLLPNAQDIGQAGVALMAQTAIAHGLDPLPGSDHLYAWTKGGKLIMTIGYKGLLHLARRQVYFTHHSRPMTDAERMERNLTSDQIAYVTEIWEIHKAKECKDHGVPYHPIVGTAIFQPVETRARKDGTTYDTVNEVPRGRDAHWVAQKNSLKDALRQITSTGTRIGQALDAMFAEVGRQAALAAGATAQQTDDGWIIDLPEDDPDTIKQELIAAGYIQPDADDDKTVIIEDETGRQFAKVGKDGLELPLDEYRERREWAEERARRTQAKRVFATAVEAHSEELVQLPSEPQPGDPWDAELCIVCQDAPAEDNPIDPSMCAKCAGKLTDTLQQS